MKIVFLSVSSGREKWVEDATQIFQKKISHFFSCESVTLPPAKGDRSSAEYRKKADTELLLKKITSDDYIVLFDEKGKSLDSRAFSKKIDQAVSSSKKRVIFIIGGPFGIHLDLYERAQIIVSLSPMTLSHHVAHLVAHEQVYRSMMILRNIPYHND